MSSVTITVTDWTNNKNQLNKPHWLPVSERIVFTLATLSFRYLDGTLQPYLSCWSAVRSFSGIALTVKCPAYFDIGHESCELTLPEKQDKK